MFFLFHDSDERLLIMHEPASASIEASSNEPSQLLMTVSWRIESDSRIPNFWKCVIGDREIIYNTHLHFKFM